MRRAARRGPLRAAVAALAVAFGGLGLIWTASASGAPVVTTVQQSASAVRSYWTESRMRNAEPASILQSAPPSLPGASSAQASKPSGKATRQTKTARYPNRTNGKVFFSLPAALGFGRQDYECSGTAVQSHNRNLVWTAGHCGYDSGFGSCSCFARNWEFVPAYDSGKKPYGEWPAAHIATTSQWQTDANTAYDFSAVTVAKRHGKALEDVIGGRRIAFDQPRGVHYNAYGYPDEPPFDGEHLYRCASPYEGADPSMGPPYPIRISCDMTAGSSGGGWVIKRRHHHRTRRFVASVTSYGYAGDNSHLYGPYQGEVARRLYRAAGG